MKDEKLYKYYSFGHDYRLLAEGRPGVPNSRVISTIKLFLENIKEFDLKVTQEVVNHQSAGLDNFLKKLEGLDERAMITQGDTSELIKIISAVDPTLDSELNLQVAYILSEKRLGLKKLIEDVSQLFSMGIFDKLSIIAKKDFSEAGKCLAFERPTAAAFHILRATEDAVKNYYLKKIKKKDRIKELLWGPMIIQLRAKKNIPKALLDSLDNIRSNFRNPTLHPELIYTMDEAQDLFSVCIDAVTRITKAS